MVSKENLAFKAVIKVRLTLPAEPFLIDSTGKKNYRNRVLKSLLSMRRQLLGDSFKPRLSLDRTPDATFNLVKAKARF